MFRSPSTPLAATIACSLLSLNASAAPAQEFKAGPRVLYEAEFSADSLPAGLSVLGGNVTVGEEDGRNVLLVLANSVIEIALPEELPSRFAVEVDALVLWGYAHPLEIRVPLPKDPKVGYRLPILVEERGVIRCSSRGSGALGKGFEIVEPQPWAETEGETPCHVMVDGDRVQVFFGEKLIADRQPIDLGRDDRLQIAIPAASGDRGAVIRRIRITAPPPDLYGEIEKTGRVTAEGIYFDTGSDVLREESRPVLEQIAGMLSEHPDLMLSIEGHTDDVGAAAANQMLSERRAAAVRAFLIDQLGIDAARLTAAGFGATRPVAPNSTDEGRQKNRRVELVRK